MAGTIYIAGTGQNRFSLMAEVAMVVHVEEDASLNDSSVAKIDVSN